MNFTLFLHSVIVITSIIFMIGGCLCTSTTFRVFNETARKHFWTREPSTYVMNPHTWFQKSNQKLILSLDECKKNHCSEVLQSTKFSNRTSSSENGLVRTVVNAYNSHTNLVLRPDDIWAAIMTQFSFYLNKNAEEFREKFVNFKGKKELVVNLTGSLHTVPYDLFIKFTNKKIDENLFDPKVKDWILPNFSTTTENDKVSIGVVFMAAFKKYFSYTLDISSAIPFITLEGTVEDWKDIQGRLEKLKEYKLEKWYDMLYPVIAEFIKAKEGQVDVEFWKRIVHYKGGSGSQQVSGWITVFVVFDRNGNWLESQPLDRLYNSRDETEKQQYFAYVETLSQWPRIGLAKIPSQIVEVDVKIVENNIEHQAVLFAGHIATEVLDDDVTIQPVLSWALALKKE